MERLRWLLEWNVGSEEWRRLKNAQYWGRQRTEYHPVKEWELAASDSRYLSSDWQSVTLRHGMTTYRDRVIPVRALFETGLWLVLSETDGPACPSSAISGACAFGVASLNAALADTDTDLLVFIGGVGLPSPREWSRDVSFLRCLTAEAADPYWHSLHRYSMAILAKRLNCTGADFLAFQSAANMVQTHGLFRGEVEGKLQVNPLLQDAFPTLRDRRYELLRRRSDLEWREESDGNRMISDEELNRFK